MAEVTGENISIEVIEGPLGRAEIFEEFQPSQALQYSVVYEGKTETFKSLGEAYIEAGLKAGRAT